jgi:hypothetical protein
VGSLAYLGRESVLDKITWRQDGWPEINAGSGPGVAASDTSLDVTDDFAGPVLDSGWRWPVGQEPIVHVASGKLVLTLRDSTQQSFVARSLLWTTYTASVGVLPGNAAGGGLGLIGDASDDLVLSREAGGLELWRADRAVRHSLWKQPLKTEGTVWLRVTSAGDGHAQFSYMSGDSGWTNAGDSVAMQGLLPWDSGLRVGLVADGESGGDARFVNFSVSGR